MADAREVVPWIDGDDVAEVYDAWCESLDSLDTEGTVEALAELAGDGPILELAIGTGRVALPLARRGLAVQGIDGSSAMVAKLREKPGGDQIPVTLGDLTDVAVAGRFALIFILFNTFFGLPSRDHQLRCLAHVAEHLTPDGLFLMETSVPDLSRFESGRKSIERIDYDEVTLIDASTHDPAAQRIDTEHVLIREGGTHVHRYSVQYASASELDAMAKGAGMRLRERRGGWRGEPFAGDGHTCVSVYQLAA
jgi:SAM-dependent methyltransferase